jgi:hypothetical protein
VPDAPLPDADTPAPPRFLPEFDNVLVAYADRSRIIPAEHRTRVVTNLGRPRDLPEPSHGSIEEDERQADRATVTVKLLEPLGRQDRAALIDEGDRLLAFAAADAGTQAIEFAAD